MRRRGGRPRTVLVLLWHSFDAAQNVRAKSIGYRNACYDTHFRNPLILLNSIDLVPQQDYTNRYSRWSDLLQRTVVDEETFTSRTDAVIDAADLAEQGWTYEGTTVVT